MFKIFDFHYIHIWTKLRIDRLGLLVHSFRSPSVSFHFSDVTQSRIEYEIFFVCLVVVISTTVALSHDNYDATVLLLFTIVSAALPLVPLSRSLALSLFVYLSRATFLSLFQSCFSNTSL